MSSMVPTNLPTPMLKSFVSLRERSSWVQGAGTWGNVVVTQSSTHLGASTPVLVVKVTTAIPCRCCSSRIEKQARQRRKTLDQAVVSDKLTTSGSLLGNGGWVTPRTHVARYPLMELSTSAGARADRYIRLSKSIESRSASLGESGNKAGV